MPKRILEEWPEGGEEMEFRLIFRGNLPSERRAGVDIKHAIRRQLHPQLRVLWQQHPALCHSFEAKYNLHSKTGKSRVEELADDYSKCGFRFVPLIKKEGFACSLNILTLLRQGPFGVMDRSDLDNRIKTLIDGLRVPEQCSELGSNLPSPDENPFFVLMDNDSAIFEFQVTAERLLIPPETGDAERDVTAIIGVRVTTSGGNPISYMSAQF
jgi:hypothetical protein